MKVFSVLSVSTICFLISLSAVPERIVFKTVKVFAVSGLRLRDQPNANGKILTLIPNLSDIEIQISAASNAYDKKSEYWLKTKYLEKKGYISSKYVSHVLKKMPSPTNKFEIFQRAPFYFDANSHEEETTLSIFAANGKQIFSQDYWNIRDMSWLNDDFALIKVFSGENVTSFGGIYKISTLNGKAVIARTVSSEGFGGGPGGECKPEPQCVCFIEENTSFGRLFYFSEKPPISIFRVNGKELNYKNKYKDDNICKVIDKSNMKLLKSFPEARVLKVDTEYYEGIKFSVDSKNFIIPANEDTVVEAP